MENTVVGRIFECMKEKGITQKQVADALGIGQGTVAGWKQRNCPPPINHLTKIAELLGESLDYLATGSYNPMSYKLTNIEQLIIQEFRTASPEVQEDILNYVLGKCDEHYMSSRSEDLWLSLKSDK